jgi:hypothetical protein
LANDHEGIIVCEQLQPLTLWFSVAERLTERFYSVSEPDCTGTMLS